MKLTPRSMAVCTERTPSCSSIWRKTLPSGDAPKPRMERLSPVLPSSRYCMKGFLLQVQTINSQRCLIQTIKGACIVRKNLLDFGLAQGLQREKGGFNPTLVGQMCQTHHR